MLALLLTTGPAWAAEGGVSSWWSWAVIGAIVVLVAGIATRMVLAARFPKDFGKWTRERRDSFAQRNDEWDRSDEEFRK